MVQHERYMRFCIDLAKSASNKVKSNPRVGSALVYNNKIIGSGKHAYFGGFHAERNAINSVPESDKHLIKDATLYVTLEPCCITNKTPPCTNIIIESQIKNVVISANDPNPKVYKKSITLLQSYGIKCTEGILEAEGQDLIRPFKANLEGLPYVILKFAQSPDAYFGKRGKQVWLSNKYTQIKVHKWRSEVDGILIGYHTANIDNPSLTTRLYPGGSPRRFILDRDLTSKKTLQIWQDEFETTFITQSTAKLGESNKKALMVTYTEDQLKLILNRIYQQGICRLMIEGGAATLKWFIEQNLWHEARIITTSTPINKGIRAPRIKGNIHKVEQCESDTIQYIFP